MCRASSQSCTVDQKEEAGPGQPSYVGYETLAYPRQETIQKELFQKVNERWNKRCITIFKWELPFKTNDSVQTCLYFACFFSCVLQCHREFNLGHHELAVLVWPPATSWASPPQTLTCALVSPASLWVWTWNRTFDFAKERGFINWILPGQLFLT